MRTLQGRGVFGGRASGKALVSSMPVNFTASFAKAKNALPMWRSEVQDYHHDLFGHKVINRVLVFPSAIGSTYTGTVLLQLMYEGKGPSAMVVKEADSLLVSGSVLAEVWFGKGIPIVELESDTLFDEIKNGDLIEVNGETGELEIN